jgi:hypothetical protein
MRFAVDVLNKIINVDVFSKCLFLLQIYVCLYELMLEK